MPLDQGDCKKSYIDGYSFADCKTGCDDHMLGDGYCNPQCDNAQCANDLGDCTHEKLLSLSSITFELWVDTYQYTEHYMVANIIFSSIISPSDIDVELE